MEITLDAEAMAAVASTAIFEQMSVEQRELVLKQAVQGLLNPRKRERFDTSPPKSPLQEAFDQAISQAAFKAVKEKIENDPTVQQHIHDLLGPLIVPALEEEAKNFNSSLADHIGRAVGLWLSEKARESR